MLLINQSQIASHISNEFQERFISNANCSFDYHDDFSLVSVIIYEEVNTILTSNVSDEEIKNALFDLGPDKSPDPDGFPPFFFKSIGLWWAI